MSVAVKTMQCKRQVEAKWKSVEIIASQKLSNCHGSYWLNVNLFRSVPPKIFIKSAMLLLVEVKNYSIA